MPIKHAIWKVGKKPQALAVAVMDTEALLEEMIVQDPTILSDRWMLIGKQVHTTHGGRIDLLALNSDAQLIVIELKRNMTPREVVAQALDYASAVSKLEPDRIASIYSNYSDGGSLGEAFRDYFGFELEGEQLNGSHQIVIVAASLDPSTERIVSYLNDMAIAINVVFFQVFEDEDRKYLSRAWLLDPVETENVATAAPASRGIWNGEYYVSFGHGDTRSWSDAKTYGFICGGGGSWYSKTLFMLEPGDRVWVNIPQLGYVGVGTVTGEAVRASEYTVPVDGVDRHIFEVSEATYNRDSVDDDENCEYFVPIEWLHTREISAAIKEVGFFGNQNTVCRPRTTSWDHTVDRLRKILEVTD